MVPHRKVIHRPKNSEYDTRPDGSLLCGPGCFSKANVLKKRYASRSKADAATTVHTRKEQEVYACDYCKGFHLAHKSKKGKKR